MRIVGFLKCFLLCVFALALPALGSASMAGMMFASATLPPVLVGYAFPGELAPTPWVSATLANIQKAKAVGANVCSIPIWHDTSASTPFTTLTTLVTMVNAQGMLAWVVPHVDTAGADAESMLWYNQSPGNLATYESWFTSICSACAGLNCVVELGNEWSYTAGQASTYSVTYTTYVAAYNALLAGLAPIAKAQGLAFAVPLPLDQSPEQSVNLQGSLMFPYPAIANSGASYVTCHMYPIVSVFHGQTLQTRLRVAQDIAAEVGLPLHLSETNAQYSTTTLELYRTTQWENVYRAQKQNRCYWQWVAASPTAYDASNAAWQGAMPPTSPSVGSGQHG